MASKTCEHLHNKIVTCSYRENILLKFLINMFNDVVGQLCR